MIHQLNRTYLTPEEIQLFRHNGFIKFPTCLTIDHIETIKSTALEDMKNKIEPVIKQNGQVIRISKIWERGGIFRQTIESEMILGPLSSLLGSNIDYILNRHNHIYLRNRESTHSLELHRDVQHWTRTIVTIMVYLEETTLANGCTHVVPGSHLLSDLLPQSTKVSQLQTVPIPMPAGGIIAINSMILHSTGINQTNGTRMSMTLGYHHADELSLANPKRILVRGKRVYSGNDEEEY